MPAPTPVTIPADAAAKAEEKGKTVDYYADLTDEERAEEGLPPREAVKTETAPGDKPTTEQKTDEEEQLEDDDATERLFEEIAGLREDIDSRLGKPEPVKTEKEVDKRLQAALDSDDDSTRYLAQQLQAANERIERIETGAREERVGRQLAKDDADFDAVRSAYTLEGKPLTEAHVEAIEDYILKNKEVGSRLTIEQVTRVVFPDAVRVGPKSPPAKGPGGSVKDEGQPVATIVDEGSAGGAPAGPWKPRPNETIESALDAARARFGYPKR